MNIEKALSAFQTYLHDYQKKELDGSLYEPIDYILSIGGKRLRPAISIWINQLYNGELEEALKVGLAIEMFHNFSLVHDDIMDEAPIRRGKETVHIKWNTNTAILSGDAMLVLVYKILSELESSKLKACLKLFNNSALNVCEGQQMDMDFENMDSIRLEDYIKMIGLKTGDLLGASFALGGLSAGASDSDIDQLYSFGKKTGIAFQLQDDILDLYGEQNKVGKQVGGDILANKKTCLWIRAFEKADKDQSILLDKMVNEKDPDRKVEMAISLFDDLKVRVEAEKVKEDIQKEAFEHLSRISIEEDKKELIKSFALSLLNREF